MKKLKDKKSSEQKKSLATVYVKLKDGVLDPQGVSIKQALDRMGYKGIQTVRSGKVFEITLDSDSKGNQENLMDEVCRKLLTNPVIEKYSFRIQK